MKLYKIAIMLCVITIGAVLIQIGSNSLEKTSIIQHCSPDNELVNFLQEYIQIDTTTQNADYASARKFLKKHALHDGMEYQEIKLPSGNSAVIITVPGKNKALPALALNHHMDVVPVSNPEEWISDPFAGEIIDGSIIGRGTQDMKGIGAVHYFALKELKKSGFPFERTVHILAVPDEEQGGFLGTKELVETPAFKALGIGFVVDEALSSFEEKTMNIKVDERKPMQILVTSIGTMAHGSQLMANNPIHHLLSFAHEIVALHEESQKNSTDRDHGILLSTNITSLQAGAFKNGKVAYNVVPHQAQATIDIRIPPAMRMSDITQKLNDLVKKYPSVSYSISYAAEEREPRKTYKTPLYLSMEKALASHGISARPQVTEGASDLRFHLKNNLDGIGITPFIVRDNIHGTNESVPVAELIRGKEIFITFLKNFCGS